ncbi:MAG TPA: Ig-like domain-containing protein [Thermodesulfobacteriota bacterium]|nr:Ig-like domain-containing protein [Deltaproteobacteria bacterium]HNT29779.1 Ig-like domain-containing protein [bacterium]HOC37882.1 Ig-like domain-containing protein [Thermodesulfobacteriota bacterium]
MSRKNPKSLGLLSVALLVAVVFPLVLFCGCGQKVSWISVEPRSVELNKEGETLQLKAVALDKTNKPVPNAVLTWQSSTPEVATVDSNGVVTAKGTGQSTVTVTSENEEKAIVQVKVVILKAIRLEPSEATIKVGEKIEIKSTVLNERDEPSEAQSVAWATTDEDIAFADDLGNVTGISPGTVTITATTPTKDMANIYGTAQITVVPGEGGAVAPPVGEGILPSQEPPATPE